MDDFLEEKLRQSIEKLRRFLEENEKVVADTQQQIAESEAILARLREKGTLPPENPPQSTDRC